VFAVSEVMESRPFRAVFRQAVWQAHASIFSESEGIVLPLVDILVVVSGALESLDPRLTEILPQIRSSLIEFRKATPAQELLRIVQALRRIAWTFPLLAFVLYGLGIWLAPNRNQALVRSALSLTIVGIALFVGFVVGGVALAAAIEDPVEQRAIVDLCAFYLDLGRWGLAIAVLGTALPRPDHGPRAGRSRLGSDPAAPRAIVDSRNRSGPRPAWCSARSGRPGHADVPMARGARRSRLRCPLHG
jgi:hypothetical protein